MSYNFVRDSFHTAVTAEALRAKICRKSAILQLTLAVRRQVSVMSMAKLPPVHRPIDLVFCLLRTAQKASKKDVELEVI